MEKKPLIVVSLCAVVLLVVASFGNVVGYQTVQSSNQSIIKERINQRELLFQTIVDIANNKKIQQIILKSQISRGILPTLEIPIVKKQQLRRMYFIGLILSKFISKTRIQSMVDTYQLITPEMQQEINAVIENDSVLKDEITQLVNSECGCEKSEWGFPIICTTLLVMMGFVFIPWFILMIIFMIPPNAVDDMLELLFLFLSPILIIWEFFNCSLPKINHPFPSNISPADGEQNVSLNLTELSFQLTDEDRGYFGLMSYTVTTNPPIGEGGEEWVRSGTYTVPIHGLNERTQYTWELLLYEGGYDATPRSYTYTFTTESLTPSILNPSPKHNALFIPISTSNVSFDLTDHQGELMNWTVETQPDIGSGAGTNVPNGRYTVPISSLEYFTTYTWFVNVTDGTYWENKTFSFRTTAENTMILEPTDDATISQKQPDENTATGGAIALRSISDWKLDGLMKCNLSTVPSNVTILYAALQAYYYDNKDGNPSGHQVNVYRITSDWNEENVTWNTQPSYVTEPSSFAIMPATINNWVLWNLTGDIQMFYNSSTPNYGWRIIDTSGDNDISYFHSKDYSEYHPFLIIEYE